MFIPLEGIIGPEVIWSAETPLFKRQNLSYCFVVKVCLKGTVCKVLQTRGIDPPLKVRSIS